MARAFAHRRRDEPVKTVAPTRTSSAPRGISPHVPESPESADRLGQRLVSLREHEADEAAAVLRVAVEGTAGHDGDPQALDEMHREGPIVFEGPLIVIVRFDMSPIAARETCFAPSKTMCS